MNNFLKKSLSVIFAVCAVFPVYAADVSERTDCSSIQARMNELSAITNPTEQQSEELTQLQTQYRNSCSKTASSRRTSGRVSTATATATTNTQDVIVETVVVTAKSVLDDYISKRQNLCDNLKNNISTLSDAGTSDTDLKPLQNQYTKDCSDIDKSTVVEVDAETAAANVAAGLCTDGSKPNQFGCCEGETFKDMGNLVFACCPDDGGDCYPPITSGD